jgi:ubiquinone/menaquinone biosynthesis C-methylase UbiE
MNNNVTDYNFDYPSLWFVLEDKIKSLLGCSLFYGADVRSLALKGNERVLDFGCGGGLATLCLAKSLNREGYVLGVDTSAYWVNIASKRIKRFPNAECKTGDITKMEIHEHSFDAIITIHVLHHIATEEMPSVSATLSKLLKAGGRLMVREKVQASHGLPPEEIRPVLSKAGLKEVSYTLSRSEYRGIFLTG